MQGAPVPSQVSTTAHFLTRRLIGFNRAKLTKNSKRASLHSTQQLKQKARTQNFAETDNSYMPDKRPLIITDIHSEQQSDKTGQSAAMKFAKENQAFCTPFVPLDSANPETRRPRMKSAARYPTAQSNNLFNLTDSKYGLVPNSSLPRTATHIYSLQKGVYGSQSGISSNKNADQLTRAQSVPNSQTIQPGSPTKTFKSSNMLG